MSARIYMPAKTATQSGRANTGMWVFEFEREKPKRIEPLMGYTSSSETKTQVKMEFPTLEAAKEFAERAGIPYTVQKPRPPRQRRTVSYAENFSYKRHIPWTH